MSVPQVKGWCPGAYRPMASGDGLVVRVRPWLGELSTKQALVLCALSERYGTGSLQLTSRANLQIRGVSEAKHHLVIAELLQADLLDEDPVLEGRRNLLMTPEWRDGDETHGLAVELMQQLGSLPDVPAKFGYVIDTGDHPWLFGSSGDIRLERDEGGGLIVVADGASAGRQVTVQTALQTVQELLKWFRDTGGAEHGRMARHLREITLPPKWSAVPRRTGRVPAQSDMGTVIGVPFGQIDSQELASFLRGSAIETLRILPERKILAVGAPVAIPDGFSPPDSATLRVQACVGAPGCPQALGSTRPIAQALARTLGPSETIHVSGCTKGCAHPKAANRTFIATPSGYDLVSHGAPWDAPTQRNLTAQDILAGTPSGDA